MAAANKLDGCRSVVPTLQGAAAVDVTGQDLSVRQLGGVCRTCRQRPHHSTDLSATRDSDSTTAGAPPLPSQRCAVSYASRRRRVRVVTYTHHFVHVCVVYVCFVPVCLCAYVCVCLFLVWRRVLLILRIQFSISLEVRPFDKKELLDALLSQITF